MSDDGEIDVESDDVGEGGDESRAAGGKVRTLHKGPLALNTNVE